MSNIKVTQEQVDGFIKTTEVMTIGEKTTLVHATLENGFTITKTSAREQNRNFLKYSYGDMGSIRGRTSRIASRGRNS